MHIAYSPSQKKNLRNHSRGTKPPCWRAKVSLGRDKQRKLQFKIMCVSCLSCPSVTFALQRGGFVPREWLAAKGLFLLVAVIPREIVDDGYAKCLE